MLFEQLHLPEPSMWLFIIIIIKYIEFQVPQNYLSPQPITAESALFLSQNQDVEPFKIQKSIHSIKSIHGIKNQKI